MTFILKGIKGFPENSWGLVMPGEGEQALVKQGSSWMDLRFSHLPIDIWQGNCVWLLTRISVHICRHFLSACIDTSQLSYISKSNNLSFLFYHFSDISCFEPIICDSRFILGCLTGFLLGSCKDVGRRFELVFKNPFFSVAAKHITWSLRKSCRSNWTNDRLLNICRRTTTTH